MRSAAAHHKAKTRPGGGKMPTAQQAIFEMKQRVVLALNKLADRDTHRIGVEELERAAEGLAPDMVSPFLSCVAETDADQKSGVRRECVRVMGALARSHGGLLAIHLGKMVGSIVKRLKDTDSVVRDACVETCGVLASSVGDGGGATFVALARPLFEALGEQNRYVQVGAALCLARVIDEASDTPQSILPQMLARVIKLLKNQHFMAKPAIIELIRSIIQFPILCYQAGCALAEHALSAAVNSILEALKSNDWATRKAASVALAGIAVNPGSSMAPLKSICIQNFGGDLNDATSASDNGWRDTFVRKIGPVPGPSGSSTCSTQKRAPLSARKLCTNNAPTHHHLKPSDWHIEISVPKSRAMPLIATDCRESERSCASSAFERRVVNTAGVEDINFGCSPDHKPDYSSVSDLASGSYEIKHATASHVGPRDNDSTNITGRNNSVIEDSGPECLRTQERKSLDSTVTDLCSHKGVEKDSTLGVPKNAIGDSINNNSGRGLRCVRSQEKDPKNASARLSNFKDVTGFWKQVKEFLSTGNVESAYVEAILSGDDLSLVQLMDRTGPVLDRLSCETTGEVLTIMATRFVDQRFLEFAIPWLQEASL
ncbi:hypothetical protein BHM03_00002292 [Ensete ventricosum]|nr:hypothetical protein BHM03_00002292 [Ensete ventricosum]